MGTQFSQPGLPGPAGAGETNDGQNANLSGIGVFLNKVGVFLRFKGVRAASTKVSVADNVGQSTVDVDVVEANLTLDNIGGTLGVAKGGTGAVNAAAARANLSAASTSHAATHLAAGSDPLPAGNINSTGLVNVKKTGVTVGSRRGVNFIEGSGIQINVTDDAGNDEVDVEVVNLGAASAPPDAQYLTLATNATLSNERVLTPMPPFSVDDAGAGGAYTLGLLHPRRFGFLIESDFVEGAITSTPFTSTVSGTGAVNTMNVPVTSRVGVMSLATGTTATGRATISTAVGTIALDAAGTQTHMLDAGMNLSAASNGTNTYTALVGFGDVLTSATQTDGVFFRYTHTENAGNWSCVCRTAGIETSVNSGVAPSFVLTTFQAMRIEVNTSNAYFYINGTLVGTVSTNIPSATGYFGHLIGMFKAVGVTSRLMYVDWVYSHSYHGVAR